MDLLSRYRAMREISTRMLVAARANDWQTLAVLEREMGGQREALRALGEPALTGLSPVERDQAGELIREILEEEHRIREIVEPWADSLRSLVERPSRRRDLQQSYGAFTQAP